MVVNVKRDSKHLERPDGGSNHGVCCNLSLSKGMNSNWKDVNDIGEE